MLQMDHESPQEDIQALGEYTDEMQASGQPIETLQQQQVEKKEWKTALEAHTESFLHKTGKYRNSLKSRRNITGQVTQCSPTTSAHRGEHKTATEDRMDVD